MADPSENLASEQAIIRAIANNVGIVDDLIKLGVDRDWFKDPLYASTVEAVATLRLRGREISPLSIMAFSTNGVSPERWKELIAIWQNPDAPDQWRTFLEPLRKSYVVRQYDEVMSKATASRKNKAGDIDTWLPSVVSGLNSLTENAAYDPRPSSHYKEDLRKVVGEIGIPYLDRALKGGIWDAALILVGGISNHGKSTLAYTIASNLVQRGLRVVFITTETLPSEVVVGVLRHMTGLRDRQVRNKEVDQDILERLDRYLAVYDYHYATIEEMDKVLRWERPTVLLYDFIKAPSGGDARTPEHQLIAEMGEGLRTLGNDHRCTIIGFGQFSAAVADQFRRTHDIREPTLFGSARLYHACDQLIIMMRHWSEPDTGFFKVKKDRLPTYIVEENLLDWQFTLLHWNHGFFQRKEDIR